MRSRSERDKLVALVRTAVDATLVEMPGAFWVEYFPWLRHIPSTPMRRFASYHKPFVDVTRVKGHESVKLAMVRCIIYVIYEEC